MNAWFPLERRTGWYLLVTAAMLVIPGCQPNGPMTVGLTYIPPESSPAAHPSSGIVLHLSPVADGRSNRESLGRTTVSILPGSDVLKWVQDGLMTLADSGFDLTLSGSDPIRGYRLRATVMRVYCRTALASLHSSVVLNVEYYRGGELIGERVHHGESSVEDSSPFEGTYRFSEGRVLQVLNGALADVVSQIAATVGEMEAS